MKTFLRFLLVLSLVSCYEVQRDCKAYKTGTFEFKYTLGGVEKIGRFTRTATLNIDYYEGKVDSSSVRWINDCEFILKKLNPRSNSDKNAIHMKILATSSNSYTFEYKLAVKKPNQTTYVEKGIAYKID